jgi:hypothetical protein
MIRNDAEVRDHRTHHETTHQRERVRDHRGEVTVRPPPPRTVVPSRPAETGSVVDAEERQARADAAQLNREINKILSNPNLSFEDMLEYFLMAILAHMDKTIKRQLDKIKNLQTQQAGNSQDQTGNRTVDMEMQELARMAKVREQAFSAFKSIIDRLQSSTDKVLQKLAQG